MYNNIIRIISLLMLLILGPLLIIVSFLIYKQMGRPILFKQERAGKKGIPFDIYKFRTMTNEKDEEGSLLPNNKRITPIGDFLRKTSLDELPQLINVVRGDITLIGPRPLHTEYTEKYNSRQRKRLDILPGITGLAQVNGRNNISWEEKFELDVYYLENQSLILDLKILLKTLIKVFKRSDINPNNNVETPRFKGD